MWRLGRLAKPAGRTRGRLGKPAYRLLPPRSRLPDSVCRLLRGGWFLRVLHPEGRRARWLFLRRLPLQHQGLAPLSLARKEVFRPPVRAAPDEQPGVPVQLVDTTVVGQVASGALS